MQTQTTIKERQEIDESGKVNPKQRSNPRFHTAHAGAICAALTRDVAARFDAFDVPDDVDLPDTVRLRSIQSSAAVLVAQAGEGHSPGGKILAEPPRPRSQRPVQ